MPQRLCPPPSRHLVEVSAHSSGRCASRTQTAPATPRSARSPARAALSHRLWGVTHPAPEPALPVSGCPPRGARSDLGRLLRALGVRRLPCEAWLAELRVRAVGLPHELSSLMRRRHTDPPLTHPRVADTSPGPARRAGCQPAPAPGHQGAPGTFPVTLRESWPRLGSPASLSPGSSVATQEAAQQRCPGAPGAGCQHQPGCPGG